MYVQVYIYTFLLTLTQGPNGMDRNHHTLVVKKNTKGDLPRKWVGDGRGAYEKVQNFVPRSGGTRLWESPVATFPLESVCIMGI